MRNIVVEESIGEIVVTVTLSSDEIIIMRIPKEQLFDDPCCFKNVSLVISPAIYGKILQVLNIEIPPRIKKFLDKHLQK